MLSHMPGVAPLPTGVTISPLELGEYGCLADFLYLAIWVPKGDQPPPRSVVQSDATLRQYYEGFGSGAGDFALAARYGGRIIGVFWSRLLGGETCGYGHVDDATPELGGALLPEWRGQGIGTTLMVGLFGILSQNGFTQTSLSVQKRNPALRLYERLGFLVVRDDDQDQIMVRPL
jgi:[ribosomal protein S18]-alanine N-acetyltransferase